LKILDRGETLNEITNDFHTSGTRRNEGSYVSPEKYDILTKKQGTLKYQL
jgi:hypothetical protein